MKRGVLLGTNPTWRVETERKEIIDAVILSVGIGVKPEAGDAVTIGLVQGVWKIIGLM